MDQPATAGLMRFIQASAHNTGLPDKSVQAIICSPPFYGQRVYEGNQDIEWPPVDYSPMPGLPTIHVDAMRCSLGNEKEIFAYTGHLVLWLRECWRTLRDDGLLFAEIADSRSSSSTYNATSTLHTQNGWKQPGKGPNAGKIAGLKPKNLIQVGARFSLAAQAEGWVFRNKIVGIKTAPPPTSAPDRFGDSYTEIFMFSKRRHYFSDMLAVRDYGNKKRNGKAAVFTREGKDSQIGMPDQTTSSHRAGRTKDTGTEGHNAWDRLTWNPAPFAAAHHAVWPESIPSHFILMSTSAHGACPICHSPYKRLVKKVFVPQADVKDPTKLRKGSNKGLDPSSGWDDTPRGTTVSTTTGWAPTCKCNSSEPIVPCVVLDPFSGSGTTVIAAAKLGRQGIGVDLSETYLTEITDARIGNGFQMEITT